MIERGHQFINAQDDEPCIPKGVYATKSYLSGEVIRHLSGTLLLAPTRESIHIGYNMHVEDEIGKYINHSFNPNTRIDMNRVIAIKHIRPFEEITFNYNVSETQMSNPFEVDGVVVCGTQFDNDLLVEKNAIIKNCFA